MTEHRLTRLAREISDEMAGENQPLPVESDPESESLDREFWKRFEARLAEADE